jgi:hypothetical protein
MFGGEVSQRASKYSLNGGSLRLDVGCPDHLAPLLGIFDREFTEFVRRACKRLCTQIGKPCLKTGIVECGIHFMIQFFDHLWRRALRRTNALPTAPFIAWIWLMNGTAIASTMVVSSVATNWSIVGTGDFDGDGKTDILWRDTAGDLAIWFMNGTAISSAGSLGNVPQAWSVAGTGDFDGDGKSDILWRDTAGDVALWLMNGGTIASSVVIGNVGSVWTVAQTGDYNGDGKSDILWRNTSTGDLALWLMNGTATSQATDFANIAVGSGWTIQSLNAD